MQCDDKKYVKQGFGQFYFFSKLVYFEEWKTRKFFQRVSFFAFFLWGDNKQTLKLKKLNF